MKTNRIRYVLLSTVIMALFACQGEMSEQLEQLSGKPTTKAALVEATVKVETAGTFAAELNKVVAGGLKTVQKLTVSGKFDAEDVDSLQLMEQLEELDILNLAFVESDKTYWVNGSWVNGAYYQVEVNTISPYLFGGMGKLSKVVLPNALVAIKRGAFSSCGALVEIKIPETVTFLGEESFTYCSSLSSITLPNVNSIGSGAFYGCQKLTDILLSDKLTSIGSQAFYDCRKLSSSFIIPNVTSIEDRTFYGCNSLKDVRLSENLTSIGSEAFYYCTSLSSIVIPNSVTSIGTNAFHTCISLKEIKLPETITSLSDFLFYNCSSLMHIDFPNTVTSIGRYSLASCGFEDITLPENLVSIGDNAFADACFETISLPEKLKTIASHAFSSNDRLKTLTIPESVTSVASGIIANCHNVTSIFWNSKIAVPSIKEWYPGSDNLLLYLSPEVNYSQSGYSNVILNGVAQEIVITEGSPYQCISAYKTKKISFNRNFSKGTALGSSSGWYTLALPFDVQTITYNSKEIAPFAKEVEDANTKRFWLRELTATNYNKDVVAIKKDQPYIIAMPNSEAYDDEFNIRGYVTFSATNSAQGIDMPVTPELPIVKGAEYSMKGTYEWVAQKASVYPINDAGNTFIPSLRAVSPFEAYVIDNDLSSAARSFSIGSSTGTRAFRPLSRKPSNDDM